MVVTCATRTTMKALVFILLCCIGCASTQLPGTSETFPVLIYQVPLPAFYRSTFWDELRIDLKLHIGTDSTVQEVQFLSVNIDPKWETAATEHILKWRFLPATQNGKPVAVWIRQSIIVRPEKSLTMVLSVINCADRSTADSIYHLIKMGEDFNTLARMISRTSSGGLSGNLGEVDIRTFPYHIQKKLERLDVGEITLPLPYGQSFSIFKRNTEEPGVKPE